MTALVGKSASELKQMLADKLVTAKEITQAHLHQLKEIEPKIQAFLNVTEELAYRQADALDKMVAAGKDLPALAGVPAAIKDNMCIPGITTTAGSKILENFQPPHASFAVQRLFDAGAICVGKANLDEFAMGSSTEHSAFKQTRNPWDTSKVPGGSSGGSAASVASGSSVVALGSDTGGSIRQPAALCGVVGMKPTYGLVSRFGIVAFASSLDQIGPFGRSVKDVALTLQAIAALDKNDSTSYRGKYPDLLHGLDRGVKGLKVAVISELLAEGIDEEVRKAVQKSLDVFKSLGATVQEISMPMLKHALPVYYLVATAEASSNLARFDGVKYGFRAQDAADLQSMYLNTRQQGFGNEVKRRIMLGTYALSSGYYDAYYKKAQQVRRLIKEEFDKEFKKFDILVSPTSPSTAFGIGEKTEDPLTMYLSDIATIPASLAGLPGISIPCGFGTNNLPIGLQILGAPLSDATILAAAHAYEQASQWHTTRSPFLDPTSLRS
jgi:aspartyl-tRNA(Asn)/glutamyl-tRNA(Gln) amidotransferase subunit A